MATVTLQPPRMGPVVKFLLISIIVVLVVQKSFEKFADIPVETIFGFTPVAFISGRVWQLFTYPFLHGGLTHALFNCVGIYLFGAELERRWGTTKFLKYYFICAIGGALLQLLVWFGSLFFFPQVANYLGSTAIIGASGAIFGILVAFGLLFGETYILLFFVVPIKAKHFAALMIFIALYAAVFY
jgi:membrane associated rhomboid family serine protease